ncbi:hypothetical protein BD310DRAFT_667326 [Dichomitus squalens]|uniref:Coiled-coil domain-containing protein 174 n=1 Tax=Dichomitus squalens TaxID=114155 RepID=A0A4Q9Q6M1_9APHY|nr:hypothetical protein BD310DRAFT_667326 [Dichomitus squalens]
MAPKDKSRAAGVSASSFMDLQAELERKKQEFAKNRAAGNAMAVVGGAKRPDKEPKWAKQNAGVHDRAARDVRQFEDDVRPSYDAARARLEKKARQYKLLQQGKSAGLSDKQYGSVLVDFEQKAIEHYQSDSDDVDESLTVPVPPQDAEDDPVIEYQDEFGRVRTARRSEVPREFLPDAEKEDDEDFDPYVIRNPVNHFPTWERSMEDQEKIKAALEEDELADIHYDASREVRAKAAGFYKFSEDEETRRRELEALNKRHEETREAREKAGAVDVLPGRIEGMRADEAAGSEPVRSRAQEKRKRELEERRRLLEARKRKKTGKEEESPSAPSTTAQVSPSTKAVSDPLAVLGAPLAKTVTNRDQRSGPSNAADAFLAQVEQEMLKR